MQESILQKFADAKFLNAILKNPEDLEALEKSAAELAKKLKQKNKRHQLPAFTLLAINPNISADEPLLDEVEAIAKSKNKLLLSRANNRPTTVLRAIILSALELLADVEQKFNLDYAKIIYLVAKESFAFINFESAEEKRIVENFIVGLGVRGEEFARKKWKVNMVASKVDSSVQLSLSGIGISKISRINFLSDIPNAKNSPLNYHNHYNNNEVSDITGVNAITFKTWYETFANAASIAISNEIERHINTQTKSINNFTKTITTELNNFSNSINTYVSDSIKNSLSGISALVERDQLNWWKESLYSESKNGSYRSISDPIALAILMSYDCGKLTHPHAPESVDYFLQETFRKVVESSEALSFGELLENLSTEEEVGLKNILPEVTEQTGILSLPQFLAGFIQGIYQKEEFEARTYIKFTETIKPTLLCVWAFHYFHVNRLTYGN